MSGPFPTSKRGPRESERAPARRVLSPSAAGLSRHGLGDQAPVAGDVSVDQQPTVLRIIAGRSARLPWRSATRVRRGQGRGANEFSGASVIFRDGFGRGGLGPWSAAVVVWHRDRRTGAQEAIICAPLT